MADTKITALTALTAADPANDVIPIVDVSDTTMAASGTTKKISVNNILGASGTATLASATITGAATVGTTLGVTGNTTLSSDLTVRTTGLILNTSGLGVGVTPTSFGGGYGTIQVSGATGAGIRMGSPTNGSYIYSDASFLNITTETNIPHRFFVNNIQQHRIEALGVFSWFDGAGGTRMTLNSTGLGVGASPSAKLHVLNTSLSGTTAGSNVIATLRSNGSGYDSFLQFSDNVANNAGLGMVAGNLYFYTGGAERARIDASGNLFVAKTSSGSANTGCELQTGTGGNAASVFTADGAIASIMNRLTSNGTIIDFRRETVSVGSISVTTTATAYNTSSDYRLKEFAQPLVGGLARVNALKPSSYNWKSDGSAGEGFLAHELSEVVPLAVTGDKDAVDADGKPSYQGVDLSKLVPILVAAIQELTARVQTLEAR